MKAAGRGLARKINRNDNANAQRHGQDRQRGTDWFPHKRPHD
jgi:hypothetical protein